MDTMTPRRISLLGVEFDDLAMEQVLKIILHRPEDAPFAYIVTPNADHLARLRKDAGLSVIYRNAFLCLLDSRLMFQLAGWLRLRPPAVITGADLASALLDKAAGRRAAVIGMTPDGFRRLAAAYPHIRFLHHEPPMGLRSKPDAFQHAVSFAIASQAAFIFLSLGSPLQERLAQAISRQSGATGIGLCIGAALQFCAGVTPRAPAWMRQAGLEWLHRLRHAPRRLTKRYLWDDPPVVAALMAEALRRRL